MAGDPENFIVDTKDGHMKHTFTGLRPNFSNLALHGVISRDILPFRKELCRRPEFQTEGLWEGPTVTFCHQSLENITRTLQEYTHRSQLPANSPLKERTARRQDYIDRATAKDTSLESLAQEAQATHGDEMLQPATPRVQPLNFDWTGNDPDFPQPTPARFKDANLRILVTGLDFVTVEMTNSPSSNAIRTVHAEDVAVWIGWLADLYNVVTHAGVTRTPYIPTGLSRSQYDNVWNADGSHDPALSDGDGQFGEQKGTLAGVAAARQ